MNFFVRKPLFAALLLFVIITGISLVLSISLGDAVCNYDHKMVHFKVEQSVSLRNLMGMDLKDLEKNGLLPTSITVKPIGWAMFVLFYIGFPVLTYLRFRFTAKKNELDNGEEVTS